MDRLRVAVLLSGEGTSLENLLELAESGDLPAEIALVIASKSKAGGLERARRRHIPAVAVPRRDHPDVDEFNDAIHAELARHEIDLIALLGFLSPFQNRGTWSGRVLNVHPALIPAFCGKGFYGHRVHEAVLESGVKVTGATVHFADDEYDHGPIILQETLRGRPGPGSGATPRPPGDPALRRRAPHPRRPPRPREGLTSRATRRPTRAPAEALPMP
jgi:formyltetrahydrofolate-dependent phosphoribosylglycinamide formyltransferase